MAKHRDLTSEEVPEKTRTALRGADLALLDEWNRGSWLPDDPPPFDGLFQETERRLALYASHGWVFSWPPAARCSSCRMPTCWTDARKKPGHPWAPCSEPLAAAPAPTSPVKTFALSRGPVRGEEFNDRPF